MAVRAGKEGDAMQEKNTGQLEKRSGKYSYRRKGSVVLACLALVLTLLFRSCSASYASANEVQVDYSTFKQWVQEDKVERVLMQSGKYTITLREGVTVELPEEDVPMAEAPETGDASLLWLAAAALSGSGLAWLALSERKRREQE